MKIVFCVVALVYFGLSGCGEETPTPPTSGEAASAVKGKPPGSTSSSKPLPGSSMEMSVKELRAKMGLDKSAEPTKKEAQKLREAENSIHTLSMAATPSSGSSMGSNRKGVMLRDVGFDRPSGVIYVSALRTYLVSNVGGKPTEADGNGFISKVTLGGSVEKLKWIDGANKRVTLHAPIGMAVRGKELFVTDLDYIRIFDLKSGRKKGQIHVPSSSSLTAIAIDKKGQIFVADSGRATAARPAGTSGVYRVTRNGKVEPLIRSAVFGRISGLILDRGVVWLTSRSASRLYGVKADGSLIRGKKQETGSLAGIVMTQTGDVLVASSSGRKVYSGPIGGPYSEALVGVQGAGLLGWDPDLSRLLIPLPRINEVEIHSIKMAKKKKRKRRKGRR